MYKVPSVLGVCMQHMGVSVRVHACHQEERG